MTYGEYLYTSNTIAYWKLNDNSNDSSPNGFNLSTLGTTYDFGRFSNCALLNGSYSAMYVDPIDHVQSHTISMWIYPTNCSGDMWMFSFGRFWTSGSNGIFIGIPDGCSGGIFYRLYNNGTLKESYGGSININEWVNIICVFDGSDMFIYKNSHLIASNVGNGSFTIGYDTETEDQFNRVALGTRIVGDSISNRYFGNRITGKFDEVIFENIAWSPTKIKRYYTQCMGMLSPGFK